MHSNNRIPLPARCNRTKVEIKSADVDYLSHNRSTSDNPRLALAHATKLVTDPEAEDKLIGIFGGVSSEESRAVQVCRHVLPARMLSRQFMVLTAPRDPVVYLQMLVLMLHYQLVASTFDYSQISPVSEARELSDKQR